MDAAPRASAGGVVRVALSPSVVLELPRVGVEAFGADSLVGTAAAWRSAERHAGASAAAAGAASSSSPPASAVDVDLVGVAAPARWSSQVVLASIARYFETGELRFAPGATQWDFLSAWAALHLVPRPPALMSSSDAAAAGAAASELVACVLDSLQRELAQLSRGEVPGGALRVIVPVWAPAAYRLIADALDAAAARVAAGGGLDPPGGAAADAGAGAGAGERAEEDGPALPPGAGAPPHGAHPRGPPPLFSTPAAALAVIERATAGLPASAGVTAARKNVAAADDVVSAVHPASLAAAAAHAREWEAHASTSCGLLRNRWVQLLVVRAFASAGLEAELAGVAAAPRLDDGRLSFDFSPTLGPSAWEHARLLVPPPRGFVARAAELENADATRIVLRPHFENDAIEGQPW